MLSHLWVISTSVSCMLLSITWHDSFIAKKAVEKDSRTPGSAPKTRLNIFYLYLRSICKMEIKYHQQDSSLIPVIKQKGWKATKDRHTTRKQNFRLKTTPPSFLPLPPQIYSQDNSPSSSWKITSKFLLQSETEKFRVALKDCKREEKKKKIAKIAK